MVVAEVGNRLRRSNKRSNLASKKWRPGLSELAIAASEARERITVRGVAALG